MNPSPKPESSLGRHLHRAFFRVLSLLPRNMRVTVQRFAFDLLFKSSNDPWSYQNSSYEAYKRRALLSALPAEFETLLEIGCADGHNLMEIKKLHPRSRLVGIDISREAIRGAQSRSQESIDFQLAVPGISRQLRETYGSFDVLIFSEMLYYVGNLSAWKELLTPLKQVIHHDSFILAVHPSSDAAKLHERLCDILGLEVVSNQQYPDPSRPFEIRIATLPKG